MKIRRDTLVQSAKRKNNMKKESLKPLFSIVISIWITIYFYELTSITELELFPFIVLMFYLLTFFFIKEINFDDRTTNVCGIILALYSSFSFYIGKIAWTSGKDFLKVNNFVNILMGVPFIAIFFIWTAIQWKTTEFIKIDRSLGFKWIRKVKWRHFSALLFVGWIPSFKANYPGILIGDSPNQWYQAIGQSALSNHHPIIHTMMIKIAITISSFFDKIINPEHAVAIYSIIQMLISAGLLGYMVFVFWDKYGAKKISIILEIIFALFPIYAIFSVYMTKDVIFSILVLLFSYLLYDQTSNDKGYQGGTLAALIITAILMIWFRSNGFLIVIGSIIVALVFSKKNFRLWTVLAIALFTCMIQRPILNYFNVEETEIVEAIGIPINQIANIVINNEEKLTDKERKLIEQVIPVQSIKDNYNCRYSDQLKWASDFDSSAIAANKIPYLQLYFQLISKYLKDALEAQINLTIGFWYPGVQKGAVSYGFDQRTDFLEWIGIKNYSTSTRYRKFISSDVRYNLLEAWLWSPGLAVMIMMVELFISVSQRKWELVLMAMPSFWGWLSLLIATPSYCETRYIYFIFLLIPVYGALLIKEKYETGRSEAYG